jgi:hypothetical protein
MSGFAAVRPDGPLYRLAREPDPWAWPAWSHAGTDGTFGNRWDDPDGSYRVLYASSQRLGAFVETLARFRADLAVVAELHTIVGPDEILRSGVVPKRWLDGRRIGTASPEGRFVDIGDARSLATLRVHLAARAIHHGLTEIDAATIRLHVPRRFTQEVSRLVYGWGEKQDGFAGIRYQSRLGDQFADWAIFEQSPSSGPVLRETDSEEIEADDPDLLEALRILGLELL